MREGEAEDGRDEDPGYHGAKDLPAALARLGAGHHRVSSLLAVIGDVLGQ
jgi:hypothetical protein